MGDMVFLKVSPWKGVIGFEKNGKLSPRYIGSFEVLEKVGEVAYRVTLPPRLAGVHNVFHVSMPRKYVYSLLHVIDHEPLQIREDFSYEEMPVQISNSKEKMLRTKVIKLIKVLWCNHLVEEATWERDDEMHEKYPHLFL